MKTIAAVIIFMMSALIGSGVQAEIYSWTDENGVKHYSHTPPPDRSVLIKTSPEIQPESTTDQEIEKLNEENVDAILEELEKEEQASAPKPAKTQKQPSRQERIEKEQAVAQKLQQRADQALLATYLSVPELEMHRDRRVELFQAQARVTELYLKNLHRRLDSLRKEASKYQPYSDDTSAPMIAPDLADDLQKTKETIARHVRNLQKYESDEREIIERFNNDIERFKILKGINEQTALASP